MKWIKVKIDYFSNTLEETKSKLINMFEEIGIKQIEVIDYFSDNSRIVEIIILKITNLLVAFW